MTQRSLVIFAIACMLAVAQEVKPEGNIFATASHSAQLSTFASLIKVAGLDDTLEGPGPFTVFAPTDAAFTKLPFATIDVLRMPVHKDMLTKVLTYHVVEGKLSRPLLLRRIEEGHGTAQIRTVGGHTLWLSMQGEEFLLRDEQGNFAKITQTDIRQSNGVIHVIDAVVMPK
ncbi:MAG: fasciclin domain-containing protein [Bryobacteraceae bacterium]